MRRYRTHHAPHDVDLGSQTTGNRTELAQGCGRFSAPIFSTTAADGAKIETIFFRKAFNEPIFPETSLARDWSLSRVLESSNAEKRLHLSTYTQ